MAHRTENCDFGMNGYGIICSMPADVCLFLRSLGGGGAERVLVNLANAFSEEGISVHLVIREPILSYKEELHPKVLLHVLNTHFFSTTAVHFAQYIRKTRPRAVMATGTVMNGCAFLAHRLSRSRGRIVLREASTPSRAFQDINRSKTYARMRFQFILKYVYPCADAVVAPSQGVREDVLKCYSRPVNNCVVIYNPAIDVRLFQLCEEPVSHSWFQEAEPIILAVGRLVPAKDFSTLISAFEKVVRVRPAKLVILGEGDLRPLLTEQVHQLGIAEYVDMPGFDRNPFRYMKRASVFVLSSRYEGLPNALIQAMACGCPVVSTDCPSGPREILDNGRYGYLVPVGNAEAMASAILDVLEHGGKTVPKEWLEMFSADQVVKRYRQVLLEE